jgi:hypothetical protein
LFAEREKLTKLQNEKKELQTVAGEARAALKESEKALNAAHEKFSRTRHRLDTLRELEDRRAVYTPTVQKNILRRKAHRRQNSRHAG